MKLNKKQIAAIIVVLLVSGFVVWWFWFKPPTPPDDLPPEESPPDESPPEEPPTCPENDYPLNSKTLRNIIKKHFKLNRKDDELLKIIAIVRIRTEEFIPGERVYDFKYMYRKKKGGLIGRLPRPDWVRIILVFKNQDPCGWKITKENPPKSGVGAIEAEQDQL